MSKLQAEGVILAFAFEIDLDAWKRRKLSPIASTPDSMARRNHPLQKKMSVVAKTKMR